MVYCNTIIVTEEKEGFVSVIAKFHTSTEDAGKIICDRNSFLAKHRNSDQQQSFCQLHTENDSFGFNTVEYRYQTRGMHKRKSGFMDEVAFWRRIGFRVDLSESTITTRGQIYNPREVLLSRELRKLHVGTKQIQT